MSSEIKNNDPIGTSISDYLLEKDTPAIIVHSDLCDDDVMPVEYLFRTYEEMPEAELLALELCKGRVLDVGAGAGCHSLFLREQGFDITAIDTSKGAIDYLKSMEINAHLSSFLDFKSEQKFDTILILMNGLGLAGRLNRLETFLSHAKSLLKPGGKIIADSSDIRYLYEDDEGGLWVDLNSQYLGEMEFQMEYKDQKTDWFPWVYIDFDTLKPIANSAGLNATKIHEDDNFHYLCTFELI